MARSVPEKVDRKARERSVPPADESNLPDSIVRPFRPIIAFACLISSAVPIVLGFMKYSGTTHAQIDIKSVLSILAVAAAPAIIFFLFRRLGPALDAAALK